MKVWTSFQQIPEEIAAKGLVITVGNFDGAHRGHQTLLERARQMANKAGCHSLVVTFKEHPSSLIRRTAPAMLMSIEERLKIFSELGLDNCLLLDFTSELMNMTPEEFLQALLGLNLKILIVGHDFRFGKGASGDTRYLLDFLNRRGLRGEVLPPVKVKGEIVSSSRIRELLLDGYLEEANHMLGRAFSVSGLVAPGAHRGRKMGFPTANLHVAPNRLLPKYGVYLAHSIIDGREYYGLSNVGIKPTFSGETPLIEAHFFDADLDLYQREISVSFLRFLRAERKFSSPIELVAQMKLDEERGRKYLAEVKNGAKTSGLFV